MAENHDNNDIEYMTDKQDITYPEDIDVIFNEEEDDNIKLIIPDYNDMKDFENNSKDDYISEEDLDFVDSVDLASSSDLDAFFEGKDDAEVQNNDNYVLEISDEQQNEPEIVNSDYSNNNNINSEPEQNEQNYVLDFDSQEQAEDEKVLVNLDEPEIIPDNSEDEEILNVDEEPSELQDVIVIEQETDNSDIEIISPQAVENITPQLPEQEELQTSSFEKLKDEHINTPSVQEIEKVEEVKDVEDIVNVEEVEEPKILDLDENINIEESHNIDDNEAFDIDEPQDIILIENSDVEEEKLSPASEDKQEPVLVGNHKSEDDNISIDTRVETELVDNALNMLNNASDFEIIEEPETDDVPLKLVESPTENSSEEKLIVDSSEEAPNFTLNEEPDVIITEPASDDDILKSIIENPEVQEEKSEEEIYLEENVFAVCNIDEKRGFYFAKNEQTVALFGYINDEIFLLKDFQDLYDKQLGIRLEERKFYSELYIVKVNAQKFLVEVDETSMRVVMDL